MNITLLAEFDPALILQKKTIIYNKSFVLEKYINFNFKPGSKISAGINSH
jgi:hypothetical protein